jgi:hypothetical protein
MGTGDINDTLRQHGPDAVRDRHDQAWQRAHQHNGASAAPHAPPSLPSRRKTSELVCFSTVRPTATDWLWHHRIPRGAQTINTGHPGTGKSQQLCDDAARVSTGTAWPDGSPCTRGDVILLTAEDALSNTVVPRLLAAGADLSRVYTLPLTRIDDRTERAFLVGEDLDELERHLVARPETLCLGIDPITAYMGVGRIDSHKTADVRGVLGPLAALAERRNIAVYTITHPPKSTTSAINAFIGSQAFIAAARVGYVTTAEADESGDCTGRSLLAMVKSNSGPLMPTLAYRLAQMRVAADERDGRDVIGSYVVWQPGTVDTTADQALAATRVGRGANESTATDEWVEFLRDVLAKGPAKVVEEIEPMARAAGSLGSDKPISQAKPCRDAREKLGIIANRHGFGRGAEWCWSLPDYHRCPDDPIDALKKRGASMEGEGIYAALDPSDPASVARARQRFDAIAVRFDALGTRLP